MAIKTTRTTSVVRVDDERRAEPKRTTIVVRVDEQQRAYLKSFAAAEGLSLSEAVRLLLQRKEPLIAARLRARQQVPPVQVVQLPPGGLEVFDRVTAETERMRTALVRPFNNLNQIAHRLNQGRELADGDRRMLESAATAINEARATLTDLARALTRLGTRG